MPVVTSNYFNRETGINTRLVEMTGVASTAINYPSDFDSNWRYIQWANLLFRKTSIIAIGSTYLAVQRENFPTLVPIWQRFMETTEVTTDPTALQSSEWVGVNNYYQVSAPQISANGILVPPRSRIQLFRDGQIDNFMYALIHETEDIEALQGIM